MKRFLSLFVSIFVASTAFADTCAKGLMPTFTANQAGEICTGIVSPTLTTPTVSGKISGLSGLNVSATLGFETVAGTGTNQGTAAALSATKQIHRLTGANGTVAWYLQASAAGDVHILLNTTAGVANIYPQSGGTINGAAADAVFAALTGIKPIICVSTATNTWICS